MKFKWWAMKYAWLRYYFDRGIGVTSPVKYIYASWGLGSKNVELIWLVGAIYIFSCFFIGYFWVRSNLASAEAEVTNIINPFMHEMRKAVKKKKFK